MYILQLHIYYYNSYTKVMKNNSKNKEIFCKRKIRIKLYTRHLKCKRNEKRRTRLTLL